MQYLMSCWLEPCDIVLYEPCEGAHLHDSYMVK